MLVGALQKLLAVVENYPQLKADSNFLQLRQELVNTEDRIQAARRFYNGNVKDLNTRCDVIPSKYPTKSIRKYTPGGIEGRPCRFA